MLTCLPNTRRLLPMLCAALLSLGAAKAQLQAHFGVNAFTTPGNSPYLETYLTFVGNSLTAKVAGRGQLQSSVLVLLTIYKDSTIVKANKYIVNGPLFSDSAYTSPSFIDLQRYPLPSGNYSVQMEITDKYARNAQPLRFRESVTIQFDDHQLQSSGIGLLESFYKTRTPNILSRNGVDMVPYCVNYFPEKMNELSFYLETYHTDTAFGAKRPFLYYYYIENSQTYQQLSAFGSFKKQETAPVNPLLAKLDIRKLGTGNYNLVVEVKDENNITHLQKKAFFQRLNKNVELDGRDVALEGGNSLDDYFGNCNNIDTLKMFVECLWPIADGVDKERTINQSIKKDPDVMKKFVVDFWQRRAADTANPVVMWKRYWGRVQEVNAMFRCGKQKGYFSERGRVYLQYGRPDKRTEQPYEPNTYPYEIWQYYRLTDQSNSQFFTNRRFVFVNHNIGDNCHVLVHSDVRGEIYNDRWRFEVTRRNNNGMGNPDNTQPAGTGLNQFNEIYDNPR